MKFFFFSASQRFRETAPESCPRLCIQLGSKQPRLKSGLELIPQLGASLSHCTQLWENWDSSDCSESTSTYLFKIATPPLLPVHHIVENRNHDIAEIWLGYQGYFQEGADQGRDEMEFVLS